MKLKTKLLLTAIAIGFIPLLLIGGFALFEIKNTLSNKYFNHIENIREIKKNQLEEFFTEQKNNMQVLLDMVANLYQNNLQKLQIIQENQHFLIEEYFQEQLNNIKFLAINSSLAKAIKQIDNGMHTEDNDTNVEHHGAEKNGWHILDEQFGNELQQYQKEYDYDDLLLITTAGDIVYSVNKRHDLGQNVLSGVLKNTHLKSAFQNGLQSVTIQDFALYPPAGNQYVAFVTAPIFHDGKLIGVLVFSLLPNTINSIIQKCDGIGKTGETYLVGKLNGQTSYRSNRLVAGKKALVGSKKSGADIDLALAGKIGNNIKTGSTGDLEMTIYAPLKIPDLDWVIITTIKLKEILIFKLLNESEDFFAKYIHHNNYYDLLLINPQGKIFYSVEHESDYDTNILTGTYANSGLGQLIQKILQTKQFGISDFAPYAPSDNKPAAFIAQPLLLHDNNIKLIIALQFSDKSTNDIMQQGSGMGITGETYLVGSDKLMRSNSILDPINRSLIASFANPNMGMVDTQASRLALAGKTGSEIIQGYHGKPVLSAYTPIMIGNNITWALIAEIDQATAFTAITKLEWLGGIIVFLIGFITLIFITRAIKSLITPLLLVNEYLKTLALGKVVDNNIKYNKNDEIGELVISARTLQKGMRISVAQANAIAGGNYDQKVKLLSEQDELGRAMIDMTNTLRNTTVKNLRDDWLKTGQAQLNEKTTGEQNITKLAKNIISFLTTYVGATVGLFYLLKNSDLCLTASYAYTANSNIPNKFAIGEGLIGQVALEQKVLVREHSTLEYTNIIQSGLAIAVTSYVIILPFLYENKVKGVIEIGISKKLTEIQGNFLELVMPNIGIAVNTADSRTQMQSLLEQSQRQTEELQSQQEELQKANEELQGQSEELQAQQEELRQSNETLEERTKDLESKGNEIQEKNRTLEINRTEMEKTQIDMEKTQAAITIKAEELELASKYKSEFLANMSHELRTPLNSLLILSKLLEENKSGNLDKKQIEYAKTINSAGNDLLTLINDILDLSKVEAGKIEIQWEDVSLNNLLTSIKQKFIPIADDKDVKFNLIIAENIPSILVTDGQRIKQIINNLLSNAFKFTNKGKVKLVVKYPDDIPIKLDNMELGKTIAISVTDSGIGIPKDKQLSIFEAFQQADGSTSRSYGGTGLGLSISRQLARLLGGELTLTSEESKGSTFTLYLPINQLSSTKSLVENTSVQTSSPLPTEPPLLTEKLQSPKQLLASDDRNTLLPNDKTILIIEDDCKFSNIIIELSNDKGFKCLLATNGLTGLELAKQYKPSAIILDIDLPQMDGLTVMDKLKDNPDLRHIPVHFMSAADHSVFAKRMGAIGYLVKPISIEKLTEAFQKIESFLAKTVKKLLVIANSSPNQQKIMDLVADKDLQIETCASIENACQKLLTITYDCVILDMELEQNTGGKMLEKMQQEESLSCKIPIIVYADRDLTPEEIFLLQSCSNEIPIKSVSLPEDLVDEVTLFLHKVETDLSNDKRKMLHMVHDKKAILRHKKVLIVDDDERNVFALATILENHDAEIVCGLNGKEALDSLKSNSDIAIVLMDIMMPEMDGYEAIQEIRKQHKYKNLPIIALTAKAMKDDRAKCIEAGANDYLAKPVDADKLLSLMRVWLYR